MEYVVSGALKLVLSTLHYKKMPQLKYKAPQNWIRPTSPKLGCYVTKTGKREEKEKSGQGFFFFFSRTKIRMKGKKRKKRGGKRNIHETQRN